MSRIRHASTALSYADGLAKAYALRGGEPSRRGGRRRRRAHRRDELGGAEQHRRGGERPVVIVVNDNGRSYAPTLGGLAQHLAGLRLTPQYEQVLDVVRERAGAHPAGRPAAL